MMYRLLRIRPSSFNRLITATSKRFLCDDQIEKSKHLEARLLSLERDLKEIKSKLLMPGKTYGNRDNPTKKERTEERKGTIKPTSKPQLKFEDDEDGDEESIEDEDESMDDGEEDEMDDEEEDFDEEDGNIEENKEEKTNQKLVNEAGKTFNEPQPEKLDGKVKSEDDINGVQNEKQKKDLTAGLTLTKLALANGKYYIRSEAPWQGHLQGKFCSISEGATEKIPSVLFDVSTDVTDNSSHGFVTFRSSLSDESYLAVQKMVKDETATVEEKEHYSGRLFLLKNDNKFSSLEAAQFELFVPLTADNQANEEEGVRAIIRSVSNQRFLSIKSGGNPFASEKDPALATVFILESKNFSTRVSKMAVPPPGIYHIRAIKCYDFSNQGCLIEDETSDKLLRSGEPSRKGLFRLSHNDDGTISLFSLTLNKYVRSNISRYLSQVGFYDDGEIAKFELHKPEKPSNGAVLLIGANFLSICVNQVSLSDIEGLADLFEFLPVKEENANVRKAGKADLP